MFWMLNLKVKVHSVDCRCIWGTLTLNFSSSSVRMSYNKATSCNLEKKHLWIVVSSGVGYTSSTENWEVFNLWDQDFACRVLLGWSLNVVIYWHGNFAYILYVQTYIYIYTYITHIYYFGLFTCWIHLKIQKNIQWFFFCIHTRHTILILIMWILKWNVLLGLP